MGTASARRILGAVQILKLMYTESGRLNVDVMNKTNIERSM